MKKKTVILDIVRSGQRRAYSDSDYEGVFTFSCTPARLRSRPSRG